MKAENQPTERAGGKGAMAGLLACGLFAAIGLLSPGLVLPQMARDFSGTPNVGLLVELVGTLASFSFALGAPFSGILISKLGCRRVTVPALVLFAVAGTAPLLLNDIWLILASRVILGLALSAIFTAGLTGIGEQPDSLRARLFGWYSVVGGLTAVVLFPAVGELGQFGWRPAFLVHLVALLVIPLVLFLPRSMGIARKRAAERQSDGASPRRSLFGPAMIGSLVVAGFAGMSMLIAPVYSPLYLTSLGITDTRTMAISITLASISATVGSAFYGRLHDILGINGIFAATMLIAGGALAIAGTTSSLPIFTLAVIVQSTMMAIAAPNISAAAMAFSPPEKSSQAIGLANGVMFGSQLFFPFLAAWLRAGTGLPGVFIAFGCGMAAIGLVVSAFGYVNRRAVAV